MDLRTFIKTALIDIVGAVQDAQSETDDGTVVPISPLNHSKVELGVTRIQVIEFDILVRADESSGTDAKIGVVTGLFGAGIKGSSATESGHESRIKLKVPIQFPTSGDIGG